MKLECDQLKSKVLDQSNKEIILEIKHSRNEIEDLKQSFTILKVSHEEEQAANAKTKEELLTEIESLKTMQEEAIPKNIRDQINKQIKDWNRTDQMFVTTRASDHVIKCLQDNSCVTLTGPAGVGKSFIARHTALVLQNEGYTIIPVYSPTDIRDYYQPGKQTVFIVDDICGNFTANQQQIESWEQLLPVINTIIADKCCKVIVCCRLQVFKDDKFVLLFPLIPCECNLISDELCLTENEKDRIADKYIGLNSKNLNESAKHCEFFPLLCYLFHEKKGTDVKEFFRIPFDVYKKELDNLSRHGDEGKHKVCGLALCVLFNNRLLEEWFQGKATDEQRQIIEDTCEACKLNRNTSKAELKVALDSLDSTFMSRNNGVYSIIHDKLFDFIAYFFGQQMIECLIEHGDSCFVNERFLWFKSIDDKMKTLDFIIEIQDKYLEKYLKRVIKIWSAGKVALVFSSINMKALSFRQQLLQHLIQLDMSQQITLANTKDAVILNEDCGAGNTPLILACRDGYTDMIQWMLDNDVDVDYYKDDKVTALIMACCKGYSDIVSILLEKNPDVNLCEKSGCSPLLMASQKGYTFIVRLLLKKNPNVDLCNNKGNSPLLLASQNGHTNIVKSLLEKNPNIVLCNNNGRNALLVAIQKGHTTIVRLMLERNPDIDLCTYLGASVFTKVCYKGYTVIVQMLLDKNINVNSLDNKGSSPLYIACQEGHVDIVRLLLEREPDVDLCNKHFCSPLLTASQNGHTDIVKLLLERTPNINLCNHYCNSPLFMACHNGHTDIVKLLLERNPKIDLCDIDGVTALNRASYKGYTIIVSMLLQKNPNVDLRDKHGCSPLYMASQEGHTDVVRLLLERNANVDLCDKDDCSPLIITISKG